jgi:hypothetical protein
VQIILELPEDIARNLQSDGTELSRTALESLAIEGVRSGKLSTGQVRRLLGFETSYQVDGFLKSHGVYLDLSLDDIEKDAQTASEFSERWSSSQTPRR